MKVGRTKTSRWKPIAWASKPNARLNDEWRGTLRVTEDVPAVSGSGCEVGSNRERPTTAANAISAAHWADRMEQTLGNMVDC
jgi:hypothetical protein